MSEIQKYEPMAEVGFPSESEWKQMSQMAAALVVSGLFKSAKTKEATIAVMLKGREMHVGPVFSVERIHAIPTQGGVTLSIDGQGMLAMIRREKSVKYHVTMPDENTATCSMRREGDDQATVITWTMKDAEKAGLTKKGNWGAYPKAMLRWRAIVDAARIVCPDVIHGLYLADEMGAETDEDGAPIYKGDNVVVVQPEDLQSKAEDAQFSEKKSEKPKDIDFPEPDPNIQKKLDETQKALDDAVEKKKAEQVKEPSGSLFDESQEASKKMAAQFRQMWGRLITGFKVATDKEVGRWTENSMLGMFAKRHGVTLQKDEDGVFHVSKSSVQEIQNLMYGTKNTNVIGLLKDIFKELEQGAVPEQPPEQKEAPPEPSEAKASTDAPKQENVAQKPTVETLAREVKEIQDELSKEYAMDGIRLQAAILKKHNCTPGKKPTIEELLKAKEELVAVCGRLLSEDPKEVLKSIQ